MEVGGWGGDKDNYIRTICPNQNVVSKTRRKKKMFVRCYSCASNRRSDGLSLTNEGLYNGLKFQKIIKYSHCIIHIVSKLECNNCNYKALVISNLLRTFQSSIIGCNAGT